MAQTDLHISFDEISFEGQKIKNVLVVPQIGSKITSRYGHRRVTDLTYDYTDDGDCDITVFTTAIR